MCFTIRHSKCWNFHFFLRESVKRFEIPDKKEDKALIGGVLQAPVITSFSFLKLGPPFAPLKFQESFLARNIQQR